MGTTDRFNRLKLVMSQCMFSDSDRALALRHWGLDDRIVVIRGQRGERRIFGVHECVGIALVYLRGQVVMILHFDADYCRARGLLTRCHALNLESL